MMLVCFCACGNLAFPLRVASKCMCMSPCLENSPGESLTSTVVVVVVVVVVVRQLFVCCVAACCKLVFVSTVCLLFWVSGCCLRRCRYHRCNLFSFHDRARLLEGM